MHFLVEGNEEKSGDGERGERLELGVATNVAFVRRGRGLPHHRQTNYAVEQTYRRMNRVADDIQIAGDQSGDQFSGDCHDIERGRRAARSAGKFQRSRRLSHGPPSIDIMLRNQCLLISQKSM
ncbi:MAG TPA: hypothetical protein VIC84_22505 [Blastocatellia bacterium]|jgi:hypothetical protein